MYLIFEFYSGVTQLVYLFITNLQNIYGQIVDCLEEKSVIAILFWVALVAFSIFLVLYYAEQYSDHPIDRK